MQTEVNLIFKKSSKSKMLVILNNTKVLHIDVIVTYGFNHMKKQSNALHSESYVTHIIKQTEVNLLFFVRNLTILRFD